MAVTAFASGTQTCVVDTEHFLANIDQTGTYVVRLDMINAAAGDIFLVRLYVMVLTAGTARLYAEQRIEHAQAWPIWDSIPVSTDLTDAQAIRVSLLQDTGVGRQVPWKVLKHA